MPYKHLYSKVTVLDIGFLVYLQRSAKSSVLTRHQKQSGNSGVVEAKSCVGDCLCLTDCPSNEENGHLPHEEAAAHSLKGVVGQKAHGCVQAALLPGLQGLKSLNALQQDAFLHCISEPNLSGYFIVVEG